MPSRNGDLLKVCHLSVLLKGWTSSVNTGLVGERLTSHPTHLVIESLLCGTALCWALKMHTHLSTPIGPSTCLFSRLACSSSSNFVPSRLLSSQPSRLPMSRSLCMLLLRTSLSHAEWMTSVPPTDFSTPLSLRATPQCGCNIKEVSVHTR